MNSIQSNVAGQRPRWSGGRDPANFRMVGLAALSTADHDKVAALIGPIEHMRAGHEINGDGIHACRAGLIVEGWACRQRLLPDGRRQILDILLPGDFVGLARVGPLARSWTVCLTRVEFADAEALRRRMTARPQDHDAIEKAFDAIGEVVLGRMLDQVVRLGRQTAYERTAHFFLEMHARARAAGIAEDGIFPLPLSQEVMADLLGLSVVHINRVLQQLKRDGLIELHAGLGRLADPDQLARACDFSPAA